MQKYTNLKAFLESEERQCSYYYRLSFNRHLKVLIGNHLFEEFVREVIFKLKSIQNKICFELKIVALPNKTWDKIRLKLLSRIKSLKAKENILIGMSFDLDDNYELSVELQTTII